MNARGALRNLLLFLGPASLVVAVALLVSNRALFAHGPGIPTAGRPEAWGLMWLCLLLVTGGHLVSVPSVAAFWMLRLWRRQPVGWAIKLSLAYHGLVAAPLAFYLSSPH